MKRPLERYAEKRAFTRTPEPAPKLPTGRRGPLLFVIQKHAARRLHYDFRLELDGVLKSWAVPKGPSLEYGDKRLAVEVEDHPFDYGSFEGVIPAKEYGAGNVIVWDCGVYSPDEDDRYSFGNREEAQERIRTELAEGKLNFFLRGEKLKGSFALVRTSSRQAVAAVEAQGSIREQQRRHPGAQPFRVDRALARRACREHRRETPRRRGAGADRAERSHAEEARPDARRERRDGELRSAMAVRAEGRWLSRDRLRPGRHRALAVAAGHRPDRRLPGARRRPRRPGRRFDDHRR